MPELSAKENLAMQLVKCGPFESRQFINKRELEGWSERVKGLQAERWPDIGRLILSQETLSSANRISDRPVIKVLRILKEKLWLDGQIRVVLVLRNQASRMASSYAQDSNRVYLPGQASFERWVDQYLRSKRHLRLLDYTNWINELTSVIGAENLCVLLLEEADSPNFWNQLANFCALERFDPDRLLRDNAGRENVRRQSRSTWSLRPLDLDVKAKVAVDRWLNLLWPQWILSGRRERIRRAAVERLRNSFDREARKLDMKTRDHEIQLSEQVRTQIDAALGTKNRELSKFLGREIRHLGY